MLTGATGQRDRANLRLSLSMLAVTESGSAYHLEELREHARAAGFTPAGHWALGRHDTLAEFRKPAA